MVIFYALTWQNKKQANPCPPHTPYYHPDFLKLILLTHEIKKLETTDMDHPGCLGKENNFQISSYLEHFPPTADPRVVLHKLFNVSPTGRMAKEGERSLMGVRRSH